MSSESRGSGSQERRGRATPDDYIFGKLIGEGSFSSVFLAKDVKLNKEVAIKVSVKQVSLISISNRIFSLRNPRYVSNVKLSRKRRLSTLPENEIFSKKSLITGTTISPTLLISTPHSRYLSYFFCHFICYFNHFTSFFCCYISDFQLPY